MAKVLGIVMAIVSGLFFIAQLFLYQNSNAKLPYNPADTGQGLVDVGLILPMVITLFVFVAGVTIFTASTEPEKH